MKTLTESGLFRWIVLFTAIIASIIVIGLCQRDPRYRAAKISQLKIPSSARLVVSGVLSRM